MEFLGLVRKIREYNRQQKLIEFIDVLFDVRKNTATHREFVLMFREYRAPDEALEHTEEVYDRLGRSRDQ